MRKCSYFRWFRHRRLSFSLSLASLLLFLLNPTHPLGRESGVGIDKIDEARAKKIHETFGIYSVLKSNNTDLTEASVWNVAESILEESRKHSLDPMLVLAIIKVESRFNHRAVSAQGARGLMQIRPPVAAAWAEEADIANWKGEKHLDDPILNIKIGVSYLSHLRKMFKDLKLTLTAYNWGPTRVRKKLEAEEEIPFGYARKVLSVHGLFRKQNRQTQKDPPTHDRRQQVSNDKL